jgi:methylmalonyl-CoA/ethylmalonyl-CoA epimerase
MKVQFRLHHIGYLVRDLLEAEVFRTRLGYVIESDVVEDPVQTAFVQFVRQPQSASLIELVTPTGQESKLSRALAKGGGLHHLCYEVDDIDAACSHLRDKQMLALSDPTPAVAFSGRRIAWFMDRGAMLVELLESGPGETPDEHSL